MNDKYSKLIIYFKIICLSLNKFQLHLNEAEHFDVSFFFALAKSNQSNYLFIHILNLFLTNKKALIEKYLFVAQPIG